MSTLDLDFKQIANDMLLAMKGAVTEYFSDVKDIADDELEDFAKRSVELAKKVKEGKISEVQAKAILKIRQNAVETVLLSIAGISLIAAQEAIEAAIGILKGVVNAAIPGVDIF
ncbi:MAG: hypothetical protein K8R86_11475 [Bacteroidales bacterium]|nr:hypothetical protein [Bacteroidales bacterium]